MPRGRQTVLGIPYQTGRSALVYLSPREEAPTLTSGQAAVGCACRGATKEIPAALRETEAITRAMVIGDRGEMNRGREQGVVEVRARGRSPS